ncbi:hypothetical protein JG688_00016008 [Phytophthora aleatoria]|uniref:RxLR effector PexRD54 WY domain-containing protein n=1 Tax=Phytophthora aleatoria TaxID=2496075 RepID=A0A8J5I4V0_9STRA|nr:hypothetical protein JG688_00016008 [Phytophthora aleatoria]
MLQRWLKEGKSAETVFTRIHLKYDQSRVFYNPQFSHWLQYVDDLAKIFKKEVSAIQTLTAKYGDEILYKMIEDAKVFPDTMNLAKRLQANQMQYWVAIRKDPDEVFHLFKLDKYVDDLNAKHPEEPKFVARSLRKYFADDYILMMTQSAKSVEGTRDIATKVEDDLLRSPLWDIWAKYLKAYNSRYPDKKATVIKVLTRKYGADHVAKILEMAKSKDTTQDIATKLASMQLQLWLRNEKTVMDVFKMLKLYRTESDFSHSPLLNPWVAYMNTIVTVNPNKMSVLLSTLETRFSERPLPQILDAAKKFLSMESAGAQLKAEKIEDIFARRVSPKKAFKMLGFDNVGESLFGSPLFVKWMKYVEVFNKGEAPKKRESWIEPIRLEYESIRLEAMKDPSTATFGQTAEKAFHKLWLDWGATPSEAFKLLRLNKAETQTLSRPEFTTWAKYLDDFNQLYPKQETTMIDGLSDSYSDINLLLILNAAKQDPNTKKIAANLQDALVDKWLAVKKDPTYLKETFRGVPTADEMIERYSKKLTFLSGTSS